MSKRLENFLISKIGIFSRDRWISYFKELDQHVNTKSWNSHRYFHIQRGGLENPYLIKMKDYSAWIKKGYFLIHGRSLQLAIIYHIWLKRSIFSIPWPSLIFLTRTIILLSKYGKHLKWGQWKIIAESIV